MSSQIEFKDSNLEIKLSGTEADSGVLEGYCATWDGPDRAGEVILKGAFTDTLSDFRTLGFLCDSHDHAREIGTIDDAFEDERGLFVKARFFSTPDAQIVRQKVREKLQRGVQPGMSIGYRVLLDAHVKGVRQLKQIELLEASVVSIPCNVRAAVSGVKSLEVDTKAWEEKENEIWYRVRDPGAFQEDSFRRIQLQKSPPVYAVIGRLKGETTTTIQALRFPVESWEMAEAKKWVADHKDSLKSFDPADLERADALRRRFFNTILERFERAGGR